MSSRARFQLALERLSAERWASFEKLASIFIAADFPNLQPLSVPEGDAGRDGVLLSPDGNEAVALQYSVASDWASKMRSTAKRLKKTRPQTRVLVYVTNQLIGARADQHKSRIQRDFGIFVEVRDESWFLDRQNATVAQEKAADELAREVVDPLLQSAGVTKAKSSALTSIESRAALVYLGLQWEDDPRSRGLTKLSFDGMVRSTLRDTDPDNRLSRSAIKDSVCRIVNSTDMDALRAQVDTALQRMAGASIRYYQADDSFCLSYEERTRLLERLAEREQHDNELSELIRRRIVATLPSINSDELSVEAERVRRISERYLLSRGEEFASTVSSGRPIGVAPVELRDLVVKDYSEKPVSKPRIEHIAAIVADLLRNPTPATQAYLRALADSYTLLAFLRVTPDVQSAVAKMFAYGEIWLDANIVLPLFAEQLVEDQHKRQFTSMIRAAVAAGMDLRITNGVLEELERHMNRSLRCASTASGGWQGRVPFLYGMYALSGRRLDKFAGWIDNFMGPRRPEEDIAEFLRANYDIHVGSLEDAANSVPQELRAMVQEYFHEVHQGRRQKAAFGDLDPMTVSRLAKHDVENYVGVIAKRKDIEGSGTLGYKYWWLTLDRAAFEIRAALVQRLTVRVPDSPAMTADFLVNYLALGPSRSRVSREVEAALPLYTERLGDFMPPELLARAAALREKYQDLPENLIQRHVRDELDDARQRIGAITQGGARLMEDTVVDAIKGSGPEPAAE